MITLATKTYVPGLAAGPAIDFLLRCDDEAYRRWWPGTHLGMHTVERSPGDVGSLVYMDELVGRRRLRLTGVVGELVPGRRISWRLAKAGLTLAVLELDFEERGAGVEVTHTVRAGWRGAGRLLDPLVRAWLSPAFARDLDEHVRTEFSRLGGLLAATR